MKIKYFEFNCNPNEGKYMEVTKEEFQRDVISTEGRFYISFGTCVLECSEKDYRDYASERNRKKYLTENSQKKKVVVVSIDDVNEQSLANDEWEDELLDKVTMDVAKPKLRIALAQLTEYERFLITEYFYNGRKQIEIANAIGQKRQTVTYQIKACLVKLAELMKK